MLADAAGDADDASAKELSIEDDDVDDDDDVTGLYGEDE